MSEEAAERGLWERYRSFRDRDAHAELTRLYTPWAHAIARSIHRRVGGYNADGDDFSQNASIGLLEAMTRFDPSRGVGFRSYASARVQGAVFDGIKAIFSDRPSPMLQQRMSSRLAESDEEGGSDPLDVLLSGVTHLGIGYLLDEALRDMVAVGSDHVGDNFQRSEIQGRVHAAMERLPDRQRTIIESYYFKDVSFTEIAGLLGVTKGRVSQLHKAAVERLRDLLREYGG